MICKIAHVAHVWRLSPRMLELLDNLVMRGVFSVQRSTVAIRKAGHFRLAQQALGWLQGVHYLRHQPLDDCRSLGGTHDQRGGRGHYNRRCRIPASNGYLQQLRAHPFFQCRHGRPCSIVGPRRASGEKSRWLTLRGQSNYLSPGLPTMARHLGRSAYCGRRI